MPEQKFRFAVGDPASPRSAVWSLITQARDAYLTPLELKTTAKLSLHLASGEFSWGYSHEYFRQNRNQLDDAAAGYGLPATTASRDFERWKRPPMVGGMTIPARIFIANEALQTDVDLPTKKAIRWFLPRPGKALGFAIVIVPANVPTSAVINHPDLELVARAEFAELQESIVVAAHHIDSAIVSVAALKSAVEFRTQYPNLRYPDHFRLYTQTIPEPETGARNFIEIPVAHVAPTERNACRSHD